MNKLEEYRDKQAVKTASASMYRVGFDAAIALELPVKFALWMKTSDFDKWVHFQSFKDSEALTKGAFQYWINNVYKPD